MNLCVLFFLPLRFCAFAGILYVRTHECVYHSEQMTSTSTRKLIVAAYLIVFALLFLFLHQGRNPLHFDEAIYAQVSKEMVERNEWLTPHWNGSLWFHKSPVYFWVTGLLFKVFGVTDFWARFPSALSGLGVLWLSYLIARRLYSETAGMLAVMILLSSQLFVFYARFGSTDAMLTLCILIAVYAYLRSEENERFWLLAGAGCALALMVKGAAGMIAPGVLLVAGLVDRRLPAIVRSQWLWLGVALAAVIALPWHLFMYWKYDGAFITNYLSKHVINRARSNLNEYNRGYGYYFTVLQDFFSPWVYILPFALVFTRRSRSFAVIILALMVFVLYTLVQTKFQWYILPAIPAFAIIIAGFLARLLENRTELKFAIGMLVLILIWVFGAIDVVRLIRTYNPEIESAAKLARLSSQDRGGIVAYPEYLEMTVKFYSGRKLCTDPVLSKLSHNESSECEPAEATHIILRTTERTKVENSFTINPLREDGPLTYASIVRR